MEVLIVGGDVSLLTLWEYLAIRSFLRFDSRGGSA
jgi:hypothetical protein